MRWGLSPKCYSPSCAETFQTEVTQLRDPGIDMIPADRRTALGANNLRHLNYDSAAEADSDWPLLEPAMR
jgi:hypothetical protein